MTHGTTSLRVPGPAHANAIPQSQQGIAARKVDAKRFTGIPARRMYYCSRTGVLTDDICTLDNGSAQWLLPES
jgi:hypothetical protein